MRNRKKKNAQGELNIMHFRRIRACPSSFLKQAKNQYIFVSLGVEEGAAVRSHQGTPEYH